MSSSNVNQFSQPCIYGNVSKVPRFDFFRCLTYTLLSISLELRKKISFFDDDDIIVGFKAGYFVSSYAERKSRFMKWLTKIFKGNRGLPRGQQPQFLGDENMVWRAPARTLVFFLLFINFDSELFLAVYTILDK